MFYGYVYNAQGYTPTHVPGVDLTTANGITAAGQIVGTYSQGRSFLYSGGTYPGTYTPIVIPDAVASATANGINAAGQIVGSYGDTEGRQHGYLATPTAIPERSTLALVATGAGVLGSVARWRRSGST